MSDEPESEIILRALDTDRDEPSAEIVETVAELNGVDPQEMDTIWGCIDGILDHVFSDPPSSEAQLQVTFSYEGYRITVEQDGIVRFVDRG